MADFKAEIKVMLRRAILDPQGRAVETTLRRLGAHNVSDVRIGKHIELLFSGERTEVEVQLARLTEEVLSNPVLEEAHTTLTELPARADAEGAAETGTDTRGVAG